MTIDGSGRSLAASRSCSPTGGRLAEARDLRPLADGSGSAGRESKDEDSPARATQKALFKGSGMLGNEDGWSALNHDAFSIGRY
jgi:hypothetical protein